MSFDLRVQFTMALSARETKYMAMIEVFKKAIWLLNLLNDLGVF